MFKIVMALVLAMSVSAFAAENGASQKAKRNLKWEAFVEACSNPAAFNNQIAQTQIVISCVDKVTTWQSAGGRPISLPESRFISAAVASNKYDVETSTVSGPVAGVPASCALYEKVTQTVSLERAVSCEDIQKVGSKHVTDYCLGETTAAKAENAKLISLEKTGETKDLCSGSDAISPSEGYEPAPAKKKSRW
jgi:hypothetical protein